ncbi:MAG: hypothetical protein U1E28_13935 [Beijerinckiaceae bacterium]
MKLPIACASILSACVFAGPASAAGARLVAADTIGCTDRALLSRAFWVQDQYDRLMRAALGAGQCRILPAGALVVTQGGDRLYSGLKRVRPVGEPQAVWISPAALAAGVVEVPVEAGWRFPLPPH